VSLVGRLKDEPGNGLLEIFSLPTDEATLLHLLEEVFAHWQVVQFGPIIQGAAYEIKAPRAPRITTLDGYATLDFGDWHMHVCIGTTVGDASNPTEQSVAAIRPCQRAELYRLLSDGAPVSWGLRLFNGAEEQLMTVLLPNPFLDENDRPCEPNWDRLELWDHLRSKFLDLAPDPVDRTGHRFVHG